MQLLQNQDSLNSVKINPSRGLNGVITVPGDKSISHRALILGVLRKCPLRISNLNQGEDVLHTLKALKSLGAEITKEKTSVVLSPSKLKPLTNEIYLGNSGTSARLLMGLLASLKANISLAGDNSLNKRPMKRVTTPLSLMGATFVANIGCLPLVITGCKQLEAITYQLPVPSAQVKSAILIAALSAQGTTRLIEPILTRDHTERLMTFLEMPISVLWNGEGERVIEVTGPYNPPCQNQSYILNIPGDLSAAAFWIVAALIVPNSKIKIKNVCWNSYRNAFCKVLIDMGAKIQIVSVESQMGEECVDIISQTSDLKGIDVSAHLAPSLIDEYPILSIAAAFAKGTTIFRGLEELRYKESDRIETISAGLKECGVRCKSEDDTLIIEGRSFKESPEAVNVDAQNDHRIAMAFGILGLAYSKPVVIYQTESVKTSYPSFYEALEFLNNNC